MKWFKISLIILLAIMLVYFLMMQTAQTNHKLEKVEYPGIAHNLN